MNELAGGGRPCRTALLSLPANWSAPDMPNKHNDARRHHIPKMKFKVTNWSTYEAGLRRRGA